MPKNRSVTFQTAIVRHFIEVSSRAFQNDDINPAIDHLYAMISPYVDDEIDQKLWEDNVRTQNPYEYMLNKVKICVIILYRMGMLPTVKYKNRVYEKELKARRSNIDDMSKQVAEEIYFKDILMAHLLSMTEMIKEHMEHNMDMYVDLLWMYLTPYITFEDQKNWELNYEVYGPGGSKEDGYFFIERKKRICMTVLDRANFLWSRSVVDADISEFDEGDYLEDIGSPPPLLPAKMVDDEVMTEDYEPGLREEAGSFEDYGVENAGVEESK